MRRRPLFLHHLQEHVEWRVGLEGRTAGEELVEDVPGKRLPVVRLFFPPACLVTYRPAWTMAPGASIRCRAPGSPCVYETEIGDVWLAALIEENVGGLEIVEDATLVGVMHGARPW